MNKTAFTRQALPHVRPLRLAATLLLAACGADTLEAAAPERDAPVACRIETDRRVYALVEYICRSYNEPLSARAVAEKFGCTAAEMNRALMLQVEKNFEEFLNYVRINRAAELLLTTDQTVTYIAMEVGYANVKTFNRNFLRTKIFFARNRKPCTRFHRGVIGHYQTQSARNVTHHHNNATTWAATFSLIHFVTCKCTNFYRI